MVRQNAENSIMYENHLQAKLEGTKVGNRHTLQPIGSNVSSIAQIPVDSLPEREHVIRVLKHESKVYKLEVAINRASGESMEGGYSERY